VTDATISPGATEADRAIQYAMDRWDVQYSLSAIAEMRAALGSDHAERAIICTIESVHRYQARVVIDGDHPSLGKTKKKLARISKLLEQCAGELQSDNLSGLEISFLDAYLGHITYPALNSSVKLGAHRRRELVTVLLNDLSQSAKMAASDIETKPGRNTDNELRLFSDIYRIFVQSTNTQPSRNIHSEGTPRKTPFTCYVIAAYSPFRWIAEDAVDGMLRRHRPVGLPLFVAPAMRAARRLFDG
jgi:hypothetical protein